MRPRIGADGWRWRLLLVRARRTGCFPRRLHKALLKTWPLRRPYFIGTSAGGTRFLGDFRDEYSFWRAARPDDDRPFLQVLSSAQALIARDKPGLLFEYNYHGSPLLGWTIKDAVALVPGVAPNRFHSLGEDVTLADLPEDYTKINDKNGYVNVFGHVK